jgi:CRP-like cAMP-binding protein
MIERLITSFLKYGSLSPEEKAAIIESTEIREFRKGDYLLKEGEVSNFSYFVLKGCIRQYSLVDGDERTSRFFQEDEWVISVEEISENASSRINWVCMENCTLVAGNENRAQALFEKFPGLESISRKVVESAFSEIQKSILSYYSETPEQRYLSLSKNQPLFCSGFRNITSPVTSASNQNH